MPLLPMDRCTNAVKYLLNTVLWLQEVNDAERTARRRPTRSVSFHETAASL